MLTPVDRFTGWVTEYGVINTMLMLCQALRRRHAPANSTFLAYAVAIEEALAGIERRKDELMKELTDA